ncbi:xanthine dehydrogenase family protein molybdopterin-binding subunit [Amycolatopsis pithecellobii]|uniref:Molybdopterin-dependent oxidoreductase n=1 Tax=Amycolatopsis pithecellobii TaxID=664692 RepID=A0A6N7YP27_9PSEU|nr:xanthine dehydrogenase family protein molybdopterin-binding subunit [Amycolatopsis pithecellobii]MTD53762.1 molybdopterin-dependent oxidoreductase [Amycolatopsis pithecellobii]
MTGTLDPVVGKPIDRVDGNAKTTGGARFTAEYPYPNLAHAALVHSTIARGRIVSVDTTAATAVPGVIAVLTHHNAPPMKPASKASRLNLSTLVSGTSVNFLNTDQVHWNGQPVAVVVAESGEAARAAARLVRVGYRPSESVVDFATAQRDAKPQPGNALMPSGAKKGDAEAALAAAAVSVDLRFTTPPLNHNAIEPHATTAAWDGDRLTVHETTQSIDWLRSHLALRFAVPRANIRIVAPYVGGGFGGKGSVWPGTLLAVLAARATGRPVRLSLTREAVYRTVGGRTPSVQRVALGADSNGKLSALVHTSVSYVGRVGGTGEPVTSQSRHLYAADTMLLRQDIVEMDLIPNTFMRAPGEAIGTFGLEAAVDELAYRLGLDPIELRMRNEPAVSPVDGHKFSHRLLREVYALGADRFGWANRSPRPGSMRDGRWLVGMGVATAYHPAMRFTADVTVRLSADGSVLVRCGFHEMGMGAATAQAQIAADALGVPFEAVRVAYGDSDLPAAPMAGGSIQTATAAGSVLAASEKLKRRLRSLARRHGTDGVHHAETLVRAGLPAIEAAVGSGTRLGRLASQARLMSTIMRDRRWARAACGAQFCEVRVDPDTGEVRVTRWTGVFDIGRVVNPKTAASQMRGGIVMGIGMALAEETLVDPRTGRIMNPGLAGYHLPVHADIPPIDVAFLDDPDPTMPLGIVGAGEVSITGVAAAVANAVHHATGRRIHDLPITLDKVMSA